MFLHIFYKDKVGSKLKLRFIPLIIIVVVLVGGGIGFWAYWQNLHNPIPGYIRKQLNFPVFYPSNKSIATVDRSTFKYDSSSAVLSFIISDDGQSITIGEQATPQAFIDVPQAYSTLVNSMNNYSSFDSIQGQVDLTYPKEFNGQQSAVLNAKGTLMFAHDTSSGLSNNQWETLFNSLNVIS